MPTETQLLEQNERLLKENRRLTHQIQQAGKSVQGEEGESRQEQTALPMHDANPYTVRNVTVLNHAINLCRNPLHNYIVRQLRADHGQDLTQILSRSVEFYDERARRRAKNGIRPRLLTSATSSTSRKQTRNNSGKTESSPPACATCASYGTAPPTRNPAASPTNSPWTVCAASPTSWTWHSGTAARCAC